MKKITMSFIWDGWKIQTDTVKAKDIKTAKEKIRKRWGSRRVVGIKVEKVS